MPFHHPGMSPSIQLSYVGYRPGILYLRASVVMRHRTTEKSMAQQFRWPSFTVLCTGALFLYATAACRTGFEPASSCCLSLHTILFEYRIVTYPESDSNRQHRASKARISSQLDYRGLLLSSLPRPYSMAICTNNVTLLNLSQKFLPTISNQGCHPALG